MILFSVHQYELEPLANIGFVEGRKTRKGALLKCVWPDQKIGYADLFPWTELGDLPLEEQLRSMARGRLSPIAEQAIWLARKDAILRFEKKNALSAEAKVKNHFLVNDLLKLTVSDLVRIKESGFSSVKVKLGRDLPLENKILVPLIKSSSLLFRLDFNSSLDFSGFENFVRPLDAITKSRIEFVEDPFPYTEESWFAASKLLPLALDHEEKNLDWSQFRGQKMPFQVLILKPARQDVDRAVQHCLDHNLKCVVTSSLDHPVGVIHSVLMAAAVHKIIPSAMLDCGCLSLRAYQPNEFNNKIITQGPYITEVLGTGIGFDSLLESLKWTPIALV